MGVVSWEAPQAKNFQESQGHGDFSTGIIASVVQS